MLTQGTPGLVSGQGELCVDFVDGHQLLLSSAAVRAWHGGEVDGVATGMGAECSVALVVPEAVLNANDNPERSAGRRGERQTNQRLVKTTPKPRATKKSSGLLLELPGPPLA